MLCYLPSRSVTDVVRDTFHWFTLNSRAIKLILSIVTVISVAVAIVFYDNTPIELLTARFSDFFILINPYSYVKPNTDNTDIIFGYCFLTFVSTLLIIPLLQRYFLDKRSLIRLTYTKYLDIIHKNINKALVLACIWTIICYGITITNWFFGLIFVIFGSILAAKSFCGWKNHRRMIYFSFYFRSLFIAMMLFCLIQASPLVCSELVGIVLYFLDDLLPNTLSTESISSFVDLFVSIVMCISYCMAVIFFNTIVILIYGSSVDTE